jgi:hypothetical protein
MIVLNGAVVEMLCTLYQSKCLFLFVYLTCTTMRTDPGLEEPYIQSRHKNLRRIDHGKFNPLLVTCPFVPPKHCASIQYNLYLADFLATIENDSDPYRHLTFYVPNLMSLFHCLGYDSG